MDVTDEEAEADHRPATGVWFPIEDKEEWQRKADALEAEECENDTVYTEE